MNPDNTTIAAIATPAGTGAVAMLRASGPGVLALAETVFRRRQGRGFPPRRALYGSITAADGTVLDDVLLTFFQGPASFTGEDTVEIACHGGVLVTRRLLQRLLEAGAQPAGPGEFTRRAFLNGRMDLTQAEAVMDIISAQTDLALRAAHRQLEGSLGQNILALRDDLLGVAAHVEAYIDFPEEDIDPDTGQALRTRLEEIRARITRLLATAEEGRILREGLRTVIAGRPNAGKSSLLNRLLGFERAIVSDIAGTTRDTIEEVISLRGFPLRLVDTAGLREDTPDAIERAGVDRTRRQLETADLVIEVVDASQPAAPALTTAARHRVLVLNKSDLGVHPDWSHADGVPLSCQTGDGMEALSGRIVALITAGGDALASGEVAVNARHKACLDQAAAALTAGVAALDAGTAPEFVAMDLRLAMEKLGEIVGRLDVEDLLGVIFSQFCIGK